MPSDSFQFQSTVNPNSLLIARMQDSVFCKLNTKVETMNLQNIKFSSTYHNRQYSASRYKSALLRLSLAPVTSNQININGNVTLITSDSTHLLSTVYSISYANIRNKNNENFRKYNVVNVLSYGVRGLSLIELLRHSYE